MSPPEIAFRIRRSLRGCVERVGILSAKNPPEPTIDNTPSGVFVHVDSISGEMYTGAAERLIHEPTPIFALDFAAEGAELQWNRDPLSGTVAPLTFGKSLDYRDEKIVGNIKYLWEPNRHLELVTLAQAFARTGNVGFLNELRKRIDSWLRQCPYPMGVNWASALELEFV